MAEHIPDLDCGGVEEHFEAVDGKGDDTAVWVPRGETDSAGRKLCSGVHGGSRAVLCHEHRGAVFGRADLGQHVTGTIIEKAVAVDTAAAKRGVVQYDGFIVVSEVALINAHIFPHNREFNFSIYEVVVDVVVGDGIGNDLELFPPAGFVPGVDIKIEWSAAVKGEQFFPWAHWDMDFWLSAFNFDLFALLGVNPDKVMRAGFRNLEV